MTVGFLQGQNIIIFIFFTQNLFFCYFSFEVPLYQLSCLREETNTEKNTENEGLA